MPVDFLNIAYWYKVSDLCTEYYLYSMALKVHRAFSGYRNFYTVASLLSGVAQYVYMPIFVCECFFEDMSFQ